MSGLLPQCLNEIGLHVIAKKNDGWGFMVEVSFIEIYNNKLKDLLGDKRKLLKINSTKMVGGRMAVQNDPLLKIDLSNQDQINEILSLATTNRSMAKTAANYTSSRSHTVFTLKMTASHAEQLKEVCGALNHVDLSGYLDMNYHLIHLDTTKPIILIIVCPSFTMPLIKLQTN